MGINIINLSKSFGKEKVIDGFNLELSDGDFICIMGKSGGGKTTLLSILMGLIKPDCGSVTGIEDKKLSAVFQENRLCENLTAFLNVKMVTDISDKYSSDDIISMFSRIGIKECKSKPVSEFSGGMKRRVAILRALMAEFDILIMDEPLKGLDDETKEAVIKLIIELTKGKTVIMTTHDFLEAEKFGAKVIHIG